MRFMFVGPLLYHMRDIHSFPENGSVGIRHTGGLFDRSKDIKLITNMEVLKALNECGDEKALSGSGEFSWMRSSVMKYLAMTPASHLTDEKYILVVLSQYIGSKPS